MADSRSRTAVDQIFHALQGTSADESEPAGAATAPTADASGEPTDDDVFVQRLKRLCEAEGEVALGRLQIIGFEAFRQRCAEQWTRYRRIVHATAETVLGRHLSANDTFVRNGDDGYIVLFHELAEEDAWEKSLSIADDLAHRLFGDEMTKDLEVAATAHTVDPDILGRGALSLHLVNQALDSRSVPSTGPAKQRADRSRRTARRTSTAVDLPAGVRVVCLPVWDVRRRVISTNFCEPRLERRNGVHETGYAVVRLGADPAVTTSLDLLTLDFAVRALSDLERLGRKMLFTVPVHIHTLRARDGGQAYVQRFKHLPPNLGRYLVCELMGTSASTPANGLSAAFGMLKPHVRSTILRCGQDYHDFALFKDFGFRYVSIDIAARQGPQPAILDEMQAFRHGADHAKLQTAIYGASTTDLATAAVDCGFNYISGDAVAAPNGTPDQARRFTPDDLRSPTTGVAG